MKKSLLLFICSATIASVAHSKLMVTKLVGKNSQGSQLGFGTFLFYDFPVGAFSNSFRIELLDFGYFPRKDNPVVNPIGFLSIKIGYKYMFSETPTGFYVEPAAGYCRVVSSTDDPSKKQYGDGVALALEGGYSLEVGQGGNAIHFGLKYESDLAGSGSDGLTANSIGFRVSFSFHLFRRRDN